MAPLELRPFLTAMILAAGAATRMGRPKQLLPLGDRCLLQHAVDAAAGSCLDEIIVVLGHRAQEIRAALQLPREGAVRIVTAPDYAHGQSASLRAGLRAASPQAQAVAILLGDQPGVSSQLIDRLAAAYVAGGSPVLRPVYCDAAGSRVPGHPVFLDRSVWPDVDKLQGDEGARTLISAHPQWLLEIPIDGEPPLDVDTWSDYERVPTKV